MRSSATLSNFFASSSNEASGIATQSCQPGRLSPALLSQQKSGRASTTMVGQTRTIIFGLIKTTTSGLDWNNYVLARMDDSSRDQGGHTSYLMPSLGLQLLPSFWRICVLSRCITRDTIIPPSDRTPRHVGSREQQSDVCTLHAYVVR